MLGLARVVLCELYGVLAKIFSDDTHSVLAIILVICIIDERTAQMNNSLI